MWKRDGDETDAYGRTVHRKNIDKPLRRYRRSYEAYFEGYTVQNSVDPSGKTVRVRVYTGARYRPELTEAQRRSYRMLHCLAGLASGVLLIVSLCLSTASNSDVAAFAVSCVPLMLNAALLYFLHVRYGAEPELTIYEFKNGVAMLRFISLAASAAAAVSVLVSLLLLPIRDREFSGTEALRALLQLLSAGLCCFIWLRERAVTFTLLPGESETES